ncbi:cocaine- and amphetamine-regulated transcript protein-like [Corythoichthys intestinalis]|uniref:cocaine- and amphetamine-regulated transcript protein-like n=1 Tax=Corythoichthys intestinalis TaxID=161448 RepID=UPI0025A5172C|nr:cocaine- and amphetamine-regulated transcript protein-like [Corythoichthys intestinalis]XP_061811187.1 cocaine- and amphetamine-regulated transcript protein-like [Nerophis lumbriciformis]
MMTMSCTGSWTVQSSRRLSGALLCALLLLLHSCPLSQAQLTDNESEEELSPRALRDFYPKGPNLTNEKQLLGALQEVLEKLQAKRLPMWEKKFGQVPTCDIGEQCAVRKGARIGKMCDCPRGAFCNFFLLKCL